MVSTTSTRLQIEVEDRRQILKYYSCVRFQGYKTNDPPRKLTENEDIKQIQRSPAIFWKTTQTLL